MGKCHRSETGFAVWKLNVLGTRNKFNKISKNKKRQRVEQTMRVCVSVCVFERVL